MDLRNLTFLKKSLLLKTDAEITPISSNSCLDKLKRVSGCYIVGAKHGYQNLNNGNSHQDKFLFYGDEPIKFPYPKGLSPVFYVGESEDLNIRIKRHLDWFEKAKFGETKHTPKPLWSYATEFGAKFAFIKCSNHKQMEKQILMSFHNKFGAIPICNAQ